MPSEIRYSNRTVIEGKLLAALGSDDPTVAVVLGQADLDILIEGLRCFFPRNYHTKQRQKELLDDLKTLREMAF